MAEIIRVFREHVPALRFIGKEYDHFESWGEWFANGWFDQIEEAMGGVKRILDIWENGGAYVGLECRRERAEGSGFSYWIGMFAPAGTVPPEGFSCKDFAPSDLGVCWIYGKEEEVHGLTGSCLPALAASGMAVDKDGEICSFENCLCPRYTTPDDKGNIILDYCYFVK